MPLSWGPSEEELCDAAANQYRPQWDDEVAKDSAAVEQHDYIGYASASDSDVESDTEEEGDDLVELMEAVGLADEYKTKDDLLLYMDADDDSSEFEDE